jgi:hypothetical protein
MKGAGNMIEYFTTYREYFTTAQVVLNVPHFLFSIAQMPLHLPSHG